jgi:serine/threonine protein kinase
MVYAVAPAASCAACGERLGANGVCLACLLRGGLEEADAAQSEQRTSFGDFEIERRDDGSLCELGRGAMGITYRARDTVLHREVALKVITPPASSRDWLTVRERFLREARAAAALRHPNIAAVYQFGATADAERCYCAMELVDGETLEARVRRDGPIKSDLAIEIGIQVARALIAAGERGLVHRDLKPGNIMLARGDNDAVEVKVIDFGLAKAVSSMEQMELTHGGFVGTPAFASPEQFAGEAVDARSDIYALAVTLWFALTGRLPSARRNTACRSNNWNRAPSRVHSSASCVPALRSILPIDPLPRANCCAPSRNVVRGLRAPRAAKTSPPRPRR